MLRTVLLHLGARRRPSLVRPRPAAFPFNSRATSSTPSSTTTDTQKSTQPWKKAVEGGKEYGPVMASVLTVLVVLGATVKTIEGLRKELEKERELREKERELREMDVQKERELREKEIQKEKEVRDEAVKRAEAQVDRRALELLFALEYGRQFQDARRQAASSREREGGQVTSSKEEEEEVGAADE